MANDSYPGIDVGETSGQPRRVKPAALGVAGFAGCTRYGPPNIPVRIDSANAFFRNFGTLSPLQMAGGAAPNYLALAVQGFFDNGGHVVWVTRICHPDAVHAACALRFEGSELALRARHPGQEGEAQIRTSLTFGPAARPFALPVGTAVWQAPPDLDFEHTAPPIESLHVLWWDESDPTAEPELRDAAGGASPLDPSLALYPVLVTLHIHRLALEPEVWSGFLAPADHPASILALLSPTHQDLDSPPVCLEAPQDVSMVRLAAALENAEYVLAGGTDGPLPGPDLYAIGLQSLESVEEVSIVALPDAAAHFGTDPTVWHALIRHAESTPNRFAILDPPPAADAAGVRLHRAQFSSTHAALYYPWVLVDHPNEPDDGLAIPPSGLLAGLYSRIDVAHGPLHPPAAETLVGVTGTQQPITKDQIELLTEDGINPIRVFPTRGFRVWGARTLATGSEYKYINVRRYLLFLERSVEQSLRWAVWEQNGETLWSEIVVICWDFLHNEWRMNHLLGQKPDQAFFVRCDRSTMTQADIDAGRCVLLVGVAPLRPAEFTIVRFGLQTATPA